MSENIIEIIGSIAAFCTTVAFLPQVIKVFRTHSVQDISRTMYSIFCLGVALWLVYGIGINSRPVIIANAITLGLAGAVLYMKFKFGNESQNQPAQSQGEQK